MEKQVFLDFGLRFNLRQTKENKPTIIYAVYVWNGTQHKVNTNLKVYPAHWDNKSQSATVSNRLSKLENKNNRIANERLFFIRDSFDEKIQYLCKTLSLSDIVNEISQAINPNAKHNKCSMKKVRITSVLSDIASKYQKEKTCEQSLFNIERLRKYLRIKNIDDDINLLNGDLLNDYQQSLINQGMMIKTISRYVRGIVTLINYLNKDETINIRIDYSSLNILKDKRSNEQKKSKNVPLTEKQLIKINKLKDLTPKEEEAKDLFICQSLLGQRISDMPKIFKGDYTTNPQEDGQETISFSVQKTGEVATLYLFPLAKEIINKYRTKKFEHYNLFETDEKKLTNIERTINKTIKDVCKKAELNSEIIFTVQIGDKIENQQKPLYELMHTHIARHTFITLMCQMGIPKEIVIIATGHTDTKMIDEVYLHESPTEKGKKLINSIKKNSSQSYLFKINDASETNKLLNALFAYDTLLKLKDADEQGINIEELEDSKKVIKTIKRLPSVQIHSDINKSDIDKRIKEIFPTLLLIADTQALILFIQKIANNNISNEITKDNMSDFIKDIQLLGSEKDFIKKVTDIYQEERSKKTFVTKLMGDNTSNDKTYSFEEFMKGVGEVVRKKVKSEGQ